MFASSRFIEKDDPLQMISFEFCKTFKNTYFVEQLRTSASVFCDIYPNMQTSNNPNWVNHEKNCFKTQINGVKTGRFYIKLYVYIYI